MKLAPPPVAKRAPARPPAESLELGPARAGRRGLRRAGRWIDRRLVPVRGRPFALLVAAPADLGGGVPVPGVRRGRGVRGVKTTDGEFGAR
jgi:hypothetical protein